MQFDEFINSTKEDAPPQSLSEPLQAMWYARKGDWETAHNIAQSISSEKAPGYMSICTGLKGI